MLGCSCEAAKKNAINPIAVPDSVPTAAALSELFQSVTEIILRQDTDARLPNWRLKHSD